MNEVIYRTIVEFESFVLIEKVGLSTRVFEAFLAEKDFAGQAKVTWKLK